MFIKEIRIFLFLALITLFLAPNVYSQTDIRTGGFVKAWFLSGQTDDPNLGAGNPESVTGFRMRKTRLTLQADINPTFSTTTWFDFSGPDGILLDFFVDASFEDEFNLRVGQFIMPGQPFDTGRRLAVDMHFFDWPAVSLSLANLMGYDALRDVGVMAFGQVGNLWYGVHAGNGLGRYSAAGTTFTARDGAGGMVGGRVDYDVADGLTLGTHYSLNRQDGVQSGVGDPSYDLNRSSYSFRLATDELFIPGVFTETEWMNVDVRDQSGGFRLNEEGAFSMHGFYSKIGYRLNPEWSIHGRMDQSVQKPGQAGTTPGDRYRANLFTAGVTHYLMSDEGEYGRLLLNYMTGDSLPDRNRSHNLVVSLQLVFL